MPMKEAPALTLSRAQRDAILAHARAGAPQEICGLVAGAARRAHKLYRIPNIAERPRIAYYMDPLAQLDAFEDIDANGWDLLGIYHSHPRGPAQPSETDIAQNHYYDDVVFIIVSLGAEPPSMRGFYIRDGGYEEVVLAVDANRP